MKNGTKGADSINTRHILFIVSGAFSKLEKVVSDRLREGTLGFGAEQREIPLDNELFRKVNTQDFIDFGFEAEFIGRLPVRVVCEHLSADDLFEILRDSEGSLIRQYEREFEAFGIKISFDESALHAIAELAAEERTGARALMTVCERLLRDFKFELPGTSISELKVDKNLVENPRKTLEEYLEAGGDLVDQKVVSEVALFCRDFEEEYQVKIEFDNAAIQALQDKAQKRPRQRPSTLQTPLPRLPIRPQAHPEQHRQKQLHPARRSRPAARSLPQPLGRRILSGRDFGGRRGEIGGCFQVLTMRRYLLLALTIGFVAVLTTLLLYQAGVFLPLPANSLFFTAITG